MAGYPHMIQHFLSTSQTAHLLPCSLVDGAARIFSYLLCRERESNSHQFSCTSFEGPWSWDALSTELSRPRRPNIDQTYDLEASFNTLVHKLGRYSSFKQWFQSAFSSILGPPSRAKLRVKKLPGQGSFQRPRFRSLPGPRRWQRAGRCFPPSLRPAAGK